VGAESDGLLLAARYHFLLDQDGIVEAVEKDNSATRKATRFHYIAD
jgi:peroxiredoxin